MRLAGQYSRCYTLGQPAVLLSYRSQCRAMSKTGQLHGNLIESHDGAIDITDGVGVSKAASRRRRETSRPRSQADILMNEVVALEKLATGKQRSKVLVSAARLMELTSREDRGTLTKVETVSSSSVPSTPAMPFTVTRPSPTLNRTYVDPPSKACTTSRALQSWSPSYTVSLPQLGGEAAVDISRIAFSLEELEQALFSPSLDGAADEATTMATELSPTATPPPSPRDSASSASSTSPPSAPQSVGMLEQTTARGTSDGEEARPCETDDERTTHLVQEVEPKCFPDAAAAASPAPVLPLPRQQPPGTASPPLENMTAAPAARGKPNEAHMHDAVKRCQTSPSAADPLPAILQCSLSDSTAATIALTHPAPSAAVLVEALHEALTWLESLPQLTLCTRKVYLESNSIVRGTSFFSADCLVELSLTPRERAAAWSTKSRLLRRISTGPERGLHFIARLGQDADSGLIMPAMDFGAELLLACQTCVVEGSAGSSLQLPSISFPSVAASVFPAPETVLYIDAVLTAAPAFYKEELAHRFAGRSGGSCGIWDVTATALAVVNTTSLHDALRVLLHSTSLTKTSHAILALRSFIRGWRSRGRKLWQSTWRSSTTGRYSSHINVGKAFQLSNAEVWQAYCGEILSAEKRTTDEAFTAEREAIAAAVYAPASITCSQSYQGACGPSSSCAGALDSLLSTASSLDTVTLTPASFANKSPAELASEVSSRSSPTNAVALIVSSELEDEQQLQFLASLRLATGSASSNHISVLLDGGSTVTAESLSLWPTAAVMTPVHEPSVASLLQSPCHLSWAYRLVEIRIAKSSSEADIAEHAAAAAVYCTEKLCTPWLLTGSGEVALQLQAVLLLCLVQYLRCGAVKGDAVEAALAPLSIQRNVLSLWSAAAPGSGRQQRVLRRLSDLHRQKKWGPVIAMSSPSTSDEVAAAFGLAATLAPKTEAAAMVLQMERTARWRCESHPGLIFLHLLDAACQLIVEGDVETAEAMNQLSVAALGLDFSLGGLFTVADFVPGGVEVIQAAMHCAMMEGHSAGFQSMALLKWMAETGLKFSALNSAAAAPFQAACKA